MKKILLALILTGCVDQVEKEKIPSIIALPTLTTVSIEDDTVTMSAEEYRWLQNSRYTMEQWIKVVSERYDEHPTYLKISGATYE